MFVQVAMHPSELPARPRVLITGRVAQAYGRLPPAALMLLAVIAVELSWAVATFVLADVGESGTAWLSTMFAAIVFTLISPPKIDDASQVPTTGTDRMMPDRTRIPLPDRPSSRTM